MAVALGLYVGLGPRFLGQVGIKPKTPERLVGGRVLTPAERADTWRRVTILGVLGTVLGVISAFLGIATHGSGNLAAVAPGVATALVATAAALSVAIPATFGYNILASRLNRLDNLLEGFGTTVIAMLVREGRV